MKKLTFIAIALVVSAPAMSQTRYWKYTADFTLSDGCKSSTSGTFTTNSKWINYDAIKEQTAKWVSPSKIKSISITSLKPIKKSEMIVKADKFSCPAPTQLFSFINDTTKLTSSLLYSGSPLSGFSTLQPSSLVWHWGDNKMPMTWLPKPNMSNIDSVEVYVQKRLTYWLNDSTLVIKKP